MELEKMVDSLVKVRQRNKMYSFTEPVSNNVTVRVRHTCDEIHSVVGTGSMGHRQQS